MMETQPMLGGNGFAVSRNLNPNLVRVETLKPLGRETRKHPPAQIRKLQASIEQFGARAARTARGKSVLSTCRTKTIRWFVMG